MKLLMIDALHLGPTAYGIVGVHSQEADANSLITTLIDAAETEIPGVSEHLTGLNPTTVP